MFAARTAFRGVAAAATRRAAPAARTAALVAARPMSTAVVGAVRSSAKPLLTAAAAAAMALTLSTSSTASVDYAAVRADIESLIESEEGYDDGSLGPVLVRLAWHSAGTYDQFSKSGGSEGATMRFNPEASHGANAGLHEARKRLENIKEKYPGISYADLYTLAGVVAIEAMGGPVVNWRPGRTDAKSGEECTPDGRLPDAARNADHVRAVFYRMGFSDREIVALCGCHAIGRCHKDRSGYDGPWSFSPVTFSNEFFRLLTEEKWVVRQWNGPMQYTDASTKTLMMLPTDMEMVRDPAFRKYAQLYAKDEEVFFKDFASAFEKLLELGVPAFEKKSSGGGFFSRIC